MTRHRATPVAGRALDAHGVHVPAAGVDLDPAALPEGALQRLSGDARVLLAELPGEARALEDVPGVGARTAATLRDAGVPDAGALAALDDAALAALPGKAGELRTAARELVGWPT